MSDTRKTMQQALEALEALDKLQRGRHRHESEVIAAWDKVNPAIEALREALAQQDTIKELAEQSMLSLWESYCDKKMQVEELQEKLDALAQQSELGNASKSEQLLASYDHALRAEFQRTKAALAQQVDCQCADQRDCTGACCVSKQQVEQQPFGTVVEYRNKNFIFYPWGDIPYLDNAIAHWVVYAGAAPAAQPVQGEQQTNWNRKIRDSVDSLLAQAGYAEDSSARHQLACMNFDAAAPAAQPLKACTCFDEAAKRLCRDKGKCSVISAHGIGADK